MTATSAAASEPRKIKLHPTAREIGVSFEPVRNIIPFGIQKLVGFARALALEPTILMLDEPSAGLNRDEREDLARFILRIKHESRGPRDDILRPTSLPPTLVRSPRGHLGTDVYRLVSGRAQGVRTSRILAMLLRERLLGLVGYLLFLTITASVALKIEGRIPAEGRRFLLLCAVLSGFGVAATIGARYTVYVLRAISICRVPAMLESSLTLAIACSASATYPRPRSFSGLTIIGDINMWVLN